jgi:uncharacterized membrane protein
MIYKLLGVLFVIVGMLTIRQAQTARRDGKAWRGRWLIGSSQAFMGVTFLLMRPEAYIVTAVGCLLSIIGMITGLIIGQRETRS